MSFAKNWSIPGPCSPIELSIPDGVSAMRGVALPLRGFTAIDLVTTAPNSSRSKNWLNSFPEPAHPLAVKIGEGKYRVPNFVL
jgi:hypothetical protein